MNGNYFIYVCINMYRIETHEASILLFVCIYCLINTRRKLILNIQKILSRVNDMISKLNHIYIRIDIEIDCVSKHKSNHLDQQKNKTFNSVTKIMLIFLNTLMYLLVHH